eukprot:CAMPEP_0168621638 /NCGR_PEP_ID=MMETSP0449_2-20121227/7812_1 /TAXON_ID=1082188 /ORGANISM="Strombidium rassoulzadegani, Strain ras09" /LENGTH=104 /DNA_ID=CAMNT_0008662793 /DNA_START=250 /DNA_END=564 /DNA_ORIENTATION=-
MTQDEEALIQTKLMEIIERLGLSFEEFKHNTIHHGKDLQKSHQIMQMHMQTLAFGFGEEVDDEELLTRAECFEFYAVQQQIQIESMSEMFACGGNQDQNSSTQG